MKNYCMFCGDEMGNVNPKSKKNVIVYGLSSWKEARMHRIIGYAHRLCLEEEDLGFLKP